MIAAAKPRPLRFPLARHYLPSIGSLLLLAAAPAHADALIDNVNGLTLNKAGQVERFTGLLIGSDGKVKRLLGRGDKRPDRGLDFRHDGKGRVMLPGMIDGHGHVMALGLKAMSLDLTAARSLAEAQAMIAAYAKANPDRSWIIGAGWNQEVWGLGRFPTAADIDAVVADRPVWLERVDGHAGWANSAAIRAAKVTPQTPSPAGGRIEKLPSGAPAGVFVDAASELVQRVVPPVQPRERDIALSKAQAILLQDGITAIADMGTSVDDWNVFRRAGDAGVLKVRIISYAAGIEPVLQVAGAGPTPWLYDDRLRMVGIKLYADGALGSRGAWLKQPYADAPKETGLGFMDDAKIRNLMVRAAMDKFQVAVHAIGDRANAQALSAIEEIAPSYKDDRRWRIEHVQIVDPADIPRLGRNGIIASMQPVHETSDWRMAEARLGPNRLAGAYAWQSILRAGGKLAFGSDVPVESPNPFSGMAAAITREDPSGQPFGGWQPQERVSREVALAGFTTGAAYAGFADDRIGMLQPGYRADFLLVDADPLESTPAQLRTTKVLETWVGGERVYVAK
ncbi:amidohydrolase family protein [Sphingomonas sp. ID1715]|uniref:amidohydrolase n=1 Tax=Sphingomonas sp. ID1715 TaxID=1656898 RepID=UPI001487C6E6|nr:amidohydrolase [Sphingomonas sp. ID1715]NNM75969.1 amidohydrolase family protein [Sphingomonas sp. ID1715]